MKKWVNLPTCYSQTSSEKLCLLYLLLKLNMGELYSSAFTLDYTIDLMLVASET